MAESGHKVRAIGAPFEIQHSSCSNLTPTSFTWTAEKSEWDVHIDRGILYQPDLSTPKQKRYGWICESRFIVPDVYLFLTHNHKVLFEKYYNKIFTCDQSLIDLNPNFKFCHSGSNYPWVPKKQWKIYSKSKLCSMFCSPKLRTEGHSYRHQVARLALDHGIDVFGGAHGTPRTVLDPKNPWSTKLEGIQEYMFSVVMENGLYDSYWTEKLTDCFATGTVPIYWGTKALPAEVNQTGIIRLEPGKESEIFSSLNLKLYEQLHQAIQDNFKFVLRLNTADDYLFKILNEE